MSAKKVEKGYLVSVLRKQQPRVNTPNVDACVHRLEASGGV